MEYQWFSVFDFYWGDMEENLRGYADSEEECRNQARNQKKLQPFSCLWYFIDNNMLCREFCEVKQMNGKAV